MMGAADTPLTSPTLLGELRDLKNHQAWARFVAQYKPLIDRWCVLRGLPPVDAEEVSAKVLYNLTRALLDFRYDPNQQFRGWLWKVVENAVRTYLRDQGRRFGERGSGDTDVQKALEQVETPEDVESLVEELDGAMSRDLDQAREAAARVQGRVKDHTWQAYWLTVMENQDPKDVAQKLGLTAAKVYVYKNRVGKMLRTEGAALRSQDPDRK